MMWGDGMGWGMGMGWGWLFWLLLVVGVIVLVTLLVVVLVRGGVPSGRPPGPGAPPSGAGPRRAREVLEERYARGEINTEEFRERLGVLEENGR